MLHIIAPAAFGGLEQVVLQMATGRTGRGLPTQVLAVVAEGSTTPPLVDQLRQAGVPTSVFACPHRAYRAEQRGILTAALEYRAEVVHTHGYRPDVLAAGPARKADAGLVSTAHGFTGGGLKSRVFEWLQRRAWRRFDVVVAVSGPLRARIVRSGVAASVAELCPNAWSGAEPLGRTAARDRLRLPSAGQFVGWVGRLSAEKGPDVMLRALALLPAEIGLVIIGDGRERAALDLLAAELGVSARITWAGSVQGAGQCMAAFDAFILSSRTEGTPMVLFEAMAAKVPIVTTAVGGVPDVVSSQDAILVRSESPEELAAGITRVFADAAGAASRAVSARQRLDERYALAAWLDRYEDFYTRAARRH